MIKLIVVLAAAIILAELLKDVVKSAVDKVKALISPKA